MYCVTSNLIPSTRTDPATRWTQNADTGPAIWALVKGLDYTIKYALEDVNVKQGIRRQDEAARSAYPLLRPAPIKS